MAASPPAASVLAFTSANVKRSTISPGSISVSPGESMRTLRSICLHDDFDMLVVNVHALGAIDPLHFVDEVALHGFAAQDMQDFLWVLGAPGERLALKQAPAHTQQPDSMFHR